MKLGFVVPQGWTGEYDGWDPVKAWQRTVQVAQQAEMLGLDSVWVFDHFTTIPEPSDEITFESFSTLTALATATSRIRLGHLVICAGYRNPAVVARMLSTMDVISGGRVELGIGAGWKRDEWESYGFGFPEPPERLAQLTDALEVITRMIDGDRHQHATYTGRHSRVTDAINVPKPLQEPRMPVLVGGNGQKVTWRLAARFADEINVDGYSPAELATVLPIIHARCEEINRDPSTLKVSIHIWAEHVADEGQVRVDRLAGFRELGIARAMVLHKPVTTDDEALPRLVEDARAAGLAFD